MALPYPGRGKHAKDELKLVLSGFCNFFLVFKTN
jgi:hypothetical protein